MGSRLDYCLSTTTTVTLFLLAHSCLTWLQLVQYTLAWVFTKKSRFSLITPVFAYPQWLPVCHRVSFMIATITSPHLSSSCPVAHKALIQLLHLSRSFATFLACPHVNHPSLSRSTSTVLLQVVLGRPLDLLPSGVHVLRAVLQWLPWSIHWSCPLVLQRILKVYSFIKSQVTDRTCLQSKYKLYEIRPTGTARRLATQWVREQPCKKINRKRKLQLNTVSLLRWRHICHESFRCWWESIPGSLTWEAR